MSTFEYIHAAPNRSVQINQQDWLYCSGTGYLGMQTHPDFIKLLTNNLQRYGSNFGGSRFSNIRFEIIEIIEQLLANMTTAPAALTFSSGTLAGQVLISYLQQLQLPFHYAPNTHPALKRADTINLPLSFSSWAKEIVRSAQQQQQPFLILCNAIDPLYAQPMSFDWLWELPQDRKHILVVDDSHGIGITGKDGGGFYEKTAIPDWVDLMVVASLGKSFAIPGGVILGQSSHINQLKNSTFFGSASPISPAFLATFEEAQKLYIRQRKVLQKRIRQFRKLENIKTLFRSIARYPVFYTKHTNLVQHLATKKIMISQFPYPNPDDDLITRIIINATHTEEDIEYLKSTIKNFSITPIA